MPPSLVVLSAILWSAGIAAAQIALTQMREDLTYLREQWAQRNKSFSAGADTVLETTLSLAR